MSHPVPMTAMVEPHWRFFAKAAKAPRCAAASMPKAKPEMMFMPPAANSCANCSALLMPCAVALRLPTIAKFVAPLSKSMRPFAYSKGGGSAVLNNNCG